MSKKLFQHIFLLIFLNLLIKPIWIFGVDMQMQNIVGESAYGIYFIMFNFSYLLHMFLDMGTHQFNNNTLSSQPQLFTKLFGNLLYLKLGFIVLYSLATLILAYFVGFSSLQASYLYWLIANQILLSIILFARSNFTALTWNKWNTFFSLFDRVVMIILMFILMHFVFKEKIQILHFVQVQTFALGVSAFLSVLLIFTKTKFVFPTFDLQEAKKILRKSLPFALVVILMTIYTRIDAVMIDKLLPQTGHYEAGIYAAGYRLLDAINMVPFLLASLLIPFFSKHLQQKEAYTEVLYTSILILVAVCVPFVLIIFTFHPQIVELLYTNSSAYWLPTFQLLLYAFPLVFAAYIFGGFLTASGETKTLSILALTTIVLNIVLNYLFIPQQGAQGAALATLISQALMAFAQIFIVFKKQALVFPKDLGFKILGFTLSNVFLMYGLSQFPFPWYLNLGIFAFLSIILSLVLRLINLQKILSL